MWSRILRYARMGNMAAGIAGARRGEWATTTPYFISIDHDNACGIYKSGEKTTSWLWKQAYRFGIEWILGVIASFNYFLSFFFFRRKGVKWWTIQLLIRNIRLLFVDFSNFSHLFSNVTRILWTRNTDLLLNRSFLSQWYASVCTLDIIKIVGITNDEKMRIYF